MIKPRYSKDDHPDFFRDLRKRVSDYFESRGISRKGGPAMFVKSVIMLLLYLTPFVLLLAVNPATWAVYLLWLVMGVGMAGIGMNIMHDAIHRSYSSSNLVNKVMGTSLYILGGNVYNWKIQHNQLHHMYTNIYGADEDVDTKFLLRLSPYAPLKKYHRLQPLYAFFLYSLMSLSFLLQDLQQLFRFRKKGLIPGGRGAFLRESTILVSAKLLYLGVFLGLPFWLTNLPIWQILTGFIFMHLLAGLILSLIFQLAHQTETVVQMEPPGTTKLENSFAIHQLRTTTDFAPDSKLLSWFAGGLNFQVEHHLFPTICHTHYPALAKIVKKTAGEYGVPYHSFQTMRAAFVSHWRTLKKLSGATG